MSQWTHVAGIIRLDSIGFNLITRGMTTKEKNDKIKEAVARALGNTWDYDSEREAMDKCTVPQGSEGSLQYAVHPNSEKDEHGAVWGNVSIWGDLRGTGKEDLPGIQGWFQKSLVSLRHPEGFGDPRGMDMPEKALYMLAVCLIRYAVLGIEVEGSPGLILLWDEDTEKVISVDVPPIPPTF